MRACLRTRPCGVGGPSPAVLVHDDVIFSVKFRPFWCDLDKKVKENFVDILPSTMLDSNCRVQSAVSVTDCICKILLLCVRRRSCLAHKFFDKYDLITKILLSFSLLDKNFDGSKNKSRKVE